MQAQHSPNIFLNNYILNIIMLQQQHNLARS